MLQNVTGIYTAQLNKFCCIITTVIVANISHKNIQLRVVIIGCIGDSIEGCKISYIHLKVV